MLFSTELLNLLLKRLIVCLRNCVVSHEGVIEESRFDKGPVAQPGAEYFLQALAKEMRGGMPEDLFADLFIEIDELYYAVSLKRAIQVDKLIILVDGLMLLWFCAGNSAAKGRVVFVRVGDFGDEGVVSDLSGHHLCE